MLRAFEVGTTVSAPSEIRFKTIIRFFIKQQQPSHQTSVDCYSMRPMELVAVINVVISACLLAAFTRSVEGASACSNIEYQPDGDNAIHQRKGILLWSWGRSGTGTVWNSMHDTMEASGMTINATCGKKEGLSASCLYSDVMRE